MKDKIHVAITGVNHYYGSQIFKVGQPVYFAKDPGNRHDAEAIMAAIPPIGKVGYVANSPHTVPHGCRSAGRIYDTFESDVFGIVRFIIKDTVIVEITDSIKGVFLIEIMDKNESHIESGSRNHIPFEELINI
jgi:hypothetical protein